MSGNSTSKPKGTFPIAVVGIGCRLPGGITDPKNFWQLLIEKTDAVREIPVDRWSISKFFHPEPGVPGKTYSKWAGLLNDITQFDPECFGISPREAHHMDPQQRLLLEVAWDAIEDAGQLLTHLANARTGVYVGISTNDYGQLQNFDQHTVGPHSATGGAFSIAANRISYCFNLSGPSMAVDTACSSSLVAVDLACESLWRGETDLAFAGGVNAVIWPGPFVAFSAATMLSPDGRCKAFDASANGFVRGEGAGMALLKPLQQAVEDRDPVYAVILATGANQDARTSGITLPSGIAQQHLLEEVYARAEINADDVFYVEAHGTGTAVGDPIEATALGNALGRPRTNGSNCLIGSVKTNIGHLEAGAGIAGLIKTALILSHRKVPPNLHFSTPNPNIAFDDLKLEVVRELTSAPTGTRRLVAGVNSFGFGGTNAHVVMASHPPRGEPDTVEASTSPLGRWLFVLSARSEEGLRQLAQAHANHLTHPERCTSMRDLCYTSACRRNHFHHRLAISATDTEELRAMLRAYVSNEKRREWVKYASLPNGENVKPVFVFSGQGPQWWAMGRQLLETNPTFQRKVEEVDREIIRHGEWSLLQELRCDEDLSRMHDTAIAQPALFALQIGLAAVLAEWGVIPAVAIGHSVGEVAAAHIAGALDLATAVQVIFHRGRCMAAAPEGRMLALGVTPEEAERLIAPFGDRVSLAAHNSPESITLSGDGDCLEEIADQFSAASTFCRFLPVNYAFHSSHLDAIQDELLRALSGIEAHPTSLDYVSTVTGRFADGSFLDREYWWDNVRQPVRFANAMDAAIERGYRVFVEISPHPVLAASISQVFARHQTRCELIPTLRRDSPDNLQVLSALGTLHTLGASLDWQGFWPEGANCQHMPGYPWQRQRYWHEPAEAHRMRSGKVVHPLLGESITAPHRYWTCRIGTKQFPYLSDHVVRGHIVFPASGYLEMALAASRELFGEPGIAESIQFTRALVLSGEDVSVELRLTFFAEEGAFSIGSQTANQEDGEWTIHCTGYLRKRSTPNELPATLIPLGTREHHETRPDKTIYEKFREVGLAYGPAFQGIQRILKNDHGIQGDVSTLAEFPDDDRYLLHPTLLDSCFQVILGALPGDSQEDHLYLPTRVGKLILWKIPKRHLIVQVDLVRIDTKELVCDVRLFDTEGHPVATLEGFTCQSIMAAETAGLANLLHQLDWEPQISDADSQIATPPMFLDRVEEESEAICIGIKQMWASYEERQSQAMSSLDALASAHIRAALVELGLRWEGGRAIDPRAAAESLQVASRHHRVFFRLLHALTEQGHLQKEDAGSWRIAQTHGQGDRQTLFRSICRSYPEWFAELTLVQRCGSQLAAILKGLADPLDVLFGQDGSLAAEHLYQDSISFRFHNGLVARTVAKAVDAVPEGRILRVLEIGAGTGGLTSHVLPVLAPNKTQYVFSDISGIFFDKARKKFQDYPFVEYRIYDVERSAGDQDFDPESFDLILASDVLHASKDLRRTLGYIQGLLAPAGMLIFLEVEHPFAWVDMIFGLTEGWWRFEDHDLRLEHPLLSPKLWCEVLRDVGFESVSPMRFEQDALKQGQVVIRARKAGPATGQQASAVSTDSALDSGENWLVFQDKEGIGASLTERLASSGNRITTVTAGDHLSERAGGQFTLPAGDRALTVELVSRLGEAGSHFTGCIYLWPLDAQGPGSDAEFDLAASETLTCYPLMHLLQAFGELGLKYPDRLLLITKDTQSIPGMECTPQIAQAPVIGLGRVIGNEFPGIQCRLVDIQCGEASTVVECILREIACNDAESEVVWRSGVRFAPRLHRMTRLTNQIDPAGATPPRFRLQPSDSGLIDRLALREIPDQPLEPGRVEIRVRAAALNFRDVLKALGLYPSDGGDFMLLGDECAGVVTAVADDVTRYRPGDRVVAVAPGSFGSYALTRQEAVIPLPTGMTFESAVTLPIAFLTAYYALHWLAHIQKGDKVLIQAAAGGVGLAALQIAKIAGAEVFATAGTPEKRDLLSNLGADHVMDSRTLAFSDQIMLLTGGVGVDIVLNSLAGEAIRKGIDCLAPYGRFLEIGKRDIYQDSKLGLWGFRENISFFAIDLGRVISGKPGLLQSLLEQIFDHLEGGEFAPLPSRTFPLSRITDAVRHMAQARHTGKIVITVDGGPVLVERQPSAVLCFHANARYLITGGLGGFGLKVAEWLADRGAGHLVLVGRSGASTTEANTAVEALRARGVTVEIVRADVADPIQIQGLFAMLSNEGPPVKGIFHAAMVIDDGILLQTDSARFRRVTAPKMDGCWNLHRSSLDQPIDHFVLFSSVSAIVGNAGQSSYAAANSFLDIFANYRRSLGLPALSVNWGRISGAGFVERNQEVAESLDKRGFLAVSAEKATAALERLLAQDASRAGVLRIDWSKQHHVSPIFQHLVTDADSGAREEQRQGQARARILQAPKEQQADAAKSYVSLLIGNTLGVSAEKLDSERPLTELGLDSLMAVELVNELENQLDVRISNAELMQNPSPARLTELVMQGLGIEASSTVTSAAVYSAAPDVVPQCIVPIRPHGSQPPLYCVHAVDGDVAVYDALASVLEPDIPIYGIQSPRVFDPDAPLLETAADLAEHYAKQIQIFQPDGPYRLLGFSLGSMLAVLAANNLEQQGKILDFVGVIDGNPMWPDLAQGQIDVLPDLILALYEQALRQLQVASRKRGLTKESIQALVEQAVDLEPEARAQRILEWFSTTELAEHVSNFSLFAPYLEAYDYHISLVPGIQLPVIKTSIHCWWSSSGVFSERVRRGDWGQYSKSGVIEETLDAGHWEIMSSPNVDHIAERICADLKP